MKIYSSNDIDILKKSDDLLNVPSGLYSLRDKNFVTLSSYINKNLEFILKEHIQGVMDKKPHLSWATFVDGDAYDDFSEEDLFRLIEKGNIIDNLKKMPCSLKLNFIEFSNDKVSQYMDDTLKEKNVSGTCVIFISPPHLKSFAFHIDPYDTMIMHVRGDKKWYFPIENNEYKFYPESFDRYHNQKQEEVIEYLFKPNECYGISKGTIHKAHNDTEEVCIHLALPFFKEDQFNYLKSLIELTLDLNEKDFFSLNEINDLENKTNSYRKILLDRIDSFDVPHETENYVNFIKNKKNEIRKKGIPTKKKQWIKL